MLALICMFLVLGDMALAEANPSSFTFRVKSKDPVSQGFNHRRSLLRNVTLPLHGAVKDFGYFYASIYLGTPAKKFEVIVDTGSTMTYVPCSTCGDGCGPNHQDAAFDPNLSSTASLIPCSSDKCRCGSPKCDCSSSKQCMYTRSYAEQSSSSGVLLEDLMSLHDGGTGAPVIFGCETRETGEIFKQRADGLFGLGNSDASVVNQLVQRGVIEDVFSLCFGTVEGDGAFTLGSSPITEGVNMQYTPLIDSPRHPFYYTVKLDGMTVGHTNLDVMSSVFSQGYGTVLDSGTTFTYVPTAVFNKFTAAVEAQALEAGLEKVPGPDPQYDDICFGGAPDYTDDDALAEMFPSLILRFAGGVTLTVSPLNYLFVHTFGSGKYCLGVFDNGASGTLLGGITFRNVLVEYDRRNKRVGFGAAQCKALGQKHRPPCSALGALASVAAADGDCEPTGTELHKGTAPSIDSTLPFTEKDDDVDITSTSTSSQDEALYYDSSEKQSSPSTTTPAGEVNNKQKTPKNMVISEDLYVASDDENQELAVADNAENSSNNSNSGATSETNGHALSAAYALLGGVVAIMIAAFAAALLRPSSRERLRSSSSTRSHHMRPDDRDPEAGSLLDNAAPVANTATVNVVGGGRSNSFTSKSKVGAVPVAQLNGGSGKVVAFNIDNSNNKDIGSTNNGATNNSIASNDEGIILTHHGSPQNKALNNGLPTIPVISMTDLSNKAALTSSAVLIGGEKRAGLTTPQKLQRTVSNVSNVSTNLGELAEGLSTTPKSIPSTPPGRNRLV